jgi:hypothetical protein
MDDEGRIVLGSGPQQEGVIMDGTADKERLAKWQAEHPDRPKECQGFAQVPARDVMNAYPTPWRVEWTQFGESMGYDSRSRIVDARGHIITTIGRGDHGCISSDEETASMIVAAVNQYVADAAPPPAPVEAPSHERPRNR